MANKPNYETNENGDLVANINLDSELSVALATANNYLDKNIIFNIQVNPLDMVRSNPDVAIIKDNVAHEATISPYDILTFKNEETRVEGKMTYKVSADELTSGNYDIVKNGTYDITNNKTVTILTPKVRIASVDISPANNASSITIPSLLGEPLLYILYNRVNNTTANRVIAAVGMNGANALLAARGTWATGANYTTNLLTTNFDRATKNFTLNISDTAAFGGNMTFRYAYLEEGQLQDTFV